MTPTAASPPPGSRTGPAILGRLRLVLWWKFGRPADAGLATLPVMLVAGIVNDGVQGFSLLAPFVAYFLLARLDPFIVHWQLKILR